MKQILEERIALLYKEIESLEREREMLRDRNAEIGIRLHQVVGAIYEIKEIIADLDRRQQAVSSFEPLDRGAFEGEDQRPQEIPQSLEISDPNTEQHKHKTDSEPA